MSPTQQMNGVGAELYIELLKRCLTRSGFSTYGTVKPARGTWKRAIFDLAQGPLRRRGMTIARLRPEAAYDDPDFQTSGETMMGMQRLNNIQECVESVVARDIPGDFIETGVWRGGGVIFMRALLKVLGDNTRRVWAADSFQGLPKPDTDRFPKDSGDQHWKSDYLAVSLEEVRQNFERYGLLDSQVRFLPGWFRDTLPSAPIERLALLRLDGDIYESTMDGLQHLYPKLSPGGRIIIDDYGAIDSCRAAVDEYRQMHGIRETMHMVEDRQRSCVFWEKR